MVSATCRVCGRPNKGCRPRQLTQSWPQAKTVVDKNQSAIPCHGPATSWVGYSVYCRTHYAHCIYLFSIANRFQSFIISFSPLLTSVKSSIIYKGEKLIELGKNHIYTGLSTSQKCPIFTHNNIHTCKTLHIIQLLFFAMRPSLYVCMYDLRLYVCRIQGFRRPFGCRSSAIY